MSILEAVNKRVEELLLVKKMSWYRLEKDSGLSKGTMLGIQYCKNRSVDLKTLVAITSTLCVSLKEFFHSSLFDDDNLEY